MNPFIQEYVDQEIHFYHLKKYEKNGINIDTVEVKGRVDDYFNKNFCIDSYHAPIMKIDGTVWMSLTAMEIQSHYLAIKRATGNVATGGLGMGYFTLRAANKIEVKKVDVYEKDERVIEFFKNSFSNRNGFEKIKFIVGDVHETLKEKEYDFFFMDIYPSMELNEEVLKDRVTILKNNNILQYQFWGEERVILEALLGKIIRPYKVREDETKLFAMWANTENSNLYNEFYDDETLIKAIKIMKR